MAWMACSASARGSDRNVSLFSFSDDARLTFVRGVSILFDEGRRSFDTLTPGMTPRLLGRSWRADDVDCEALWSANTKRGSARRTSMAPLLRWGYEYCPFRFWLTTAAVVEYESVRLHFFSPRQHGHYFPALAGH